MYDLVTKEQLTAIHFSKKLIIKLILVFDKHFYIICLFCISFIHFDCMIPLFKQRFITDTVTTCEKRRKGNTNDVEVIFMPTKALDHALEFRMFGKLVVKKQFEIKKGL